MPSEELPADMREMKPEARAEYVADKAKKREMLRHRIAEVNTERERYLSEQRRAAKAPSQGPGQAIDEALLGGLRNEAEKSGFAF
jgi:hypothetical protein